jgi:hypothetical protein
VKRVVLDDHLLRDVLADNVNAALGRLLATHGYWTTNFYYLRLCKSVVLARGGQLTGSWTQEQRVALGTRLLDLSEINVVALPTIAIRIAELTDRYRLSNLGAEAVASAEHLGATLAVWEGDDGLNIRRASKDLGVTYKTIKR